MDNKRAGQASCRQSCESRITRGERLGRRRSISAPFKRAPQVDSYKDQLAEDFHKSASTDVNNKGKKSRKTQKKVRTLTQAQELFARNLTFIRELAYSDPQIFAADCEQMIEAAARHLPGYAHRRMPDNDEAFQLWIRSIIEAAVSRIGTSYSMKKQFDSMRKQYADSVRKGLRLILVDCFDLGFSPEFDIPALESEVWMSVWNNLDNWLAPSTVSMSTRLIELAKRYALGWRTERIKERTETMSLEDARREELRIAKRQPKPRRIILGPDDSYADKPAIYRDEAFDIPTEDEHFAAAA
jgi:hypothetical protein